MSELKKCPFCGGEADIEEIPGSPFTDEPYTWGVGCKECNIGWYEETKEESIAKWNRRAQPENMPLTLDELRQMDGEPVYFIRLDDDGDMRWAEWRLLLVQGDTIQGFKGEPSEWIEDYGKTWIAYRQKPGSDRQ
jgi:Lar family restriction alleviation protein